MLKQAKMFAKRTAQRAGYDVVQFHEHELPRANYDTMTRFLYFNRLFQQISHIDGDVVECGVGRGESMLWWSTLVKNELKGRKLWGFDSFEGFPEPAKEDQGVFKLKKGQLGDTSIDKVTTLLRTAGIDNHFIDYQVTLVKGFFEHSLDKYRGSSIALLHLDVDLYESYRTCLQYLYPKVAPGGIVLFDEYLSTTDYLIFPGAQQAIDEYFGPTKTPILRDTASGKYYVVKPSGTSGENV